MKIARSLMALVIFVTQVVMAQNDQSTAVGNNHFESYQIDSIDTVSPLNGNVVLHIPLYSIAQKGRIPLTFSISGNTLQLKETYYCGDLACDAQYYHYQLGVYCTNGIGLRFDGDLEVCQSVTDWKDVGADGTYTDNATAAYQVTVGGTNTSPLIQTNSDSKKYRSSDGSGFLLAGSTSLYTVATGSADGNPYPYSGNFSLYQKDGTKSTFTSQTLPGGYSGSLEQKREDTNGNRILRGISGAIASRLYLQDTLDRVFLDAPRETAAGFGMSSDTSMCPTTAAQYQEATSSYSWTVPSVNNGSASFVFCYATIHLRTNFYGFGPGGNGSSSGSPSTGWADINNATTLVLQAVKLPDGTSWKFEYDAANPNDSSSAGYGDLTKVITPQGGSITYSYNIASVCKEVGPQGSTSIRYVQQKAVDDGAGHVRTWNYEIPVSGTSQAKIIFPSEDGEGTRNETTIVYGQPGSVAGYVSPCPIVERERYVYQGSSSSNNYLEHTTTSYQYATTDVPDTSSLITFTSVFPSSTQLSRGSDSSSTEKQYDSGFTGMYTVCMTNSWSTGSTSCGPWYQNGVVETVPISYGFPKSSTIKDGSGTVLRNETFSYRWESTADTTYLDANLLNTVTQDIISGTPGRTVTIGYDESGMGPQGAYGNETSRTTAVNGTQVGTSTKYNSNGTPSSTWDARGSETVLSYDSTGAFLKSSVKSGFTTQYALDSVLGTPTSITDSNNVTTSYEYNDPLARITKIKRAVNTPAESWTQYSYPSATTVQISSDKDRAGDGLVVSTTVTDGLSRPISVSIGGNITSTTYSATGKIQSTSNPSGGSNSIAGYQSSSYDALGRPLLICNQDNGQTNPLVCEQGNSYKRLVYSGFTTLLIDETGRATKVVTDALGQLTDVYEDVQDSTWNPGGANIHTQYGYDSLGNLTTVYQYGSGSGSQRNRSFKYDSLSRLLWANNPESGFICYGTGSPNQNGCNADGYDGNGNLLSMTNANSVHTSLSYDTFDHLLSKSFDDGTASTCFEYGPSGSSSYRTNRLTHEWTKAGACDSANPQITSRTVLAYDPLGRVSKEQQCHLSRCTTGSSFSNAMQYDLAGNMSFFTNGIQGISLTQSYDNSNRLLTVGSSLFDSTHPASLFSVGAYMPFGAIQNVTLGGNIDVTKSYDSRLRTTGALVSHP